MTNFLFLLFPLAAAASPCTPAALQFRSVPETSYANAPVAVEVYTADQNGRPCLHDNVTLVQLVLADGSGSMKDHGHELAGGLTAPLLVKNGVARFDNISFTDPGMKNLRAIDGAATRALTPADADPIAVASFGMADHLKFLVQPGDGARSSWLTQPVVEIVDAFDNTISTDNSRVITLDCVAPLSMPACSLTGTLSLTTVNGVATFQGVSAQTAGPVQGLVIRARAEPGDLSLISAPFDTH